MGTDWPRQTPLTHPQSDLIWTSHACLLFAAEAAGSRRKQQDQSQTKWSLSCAGDGTHHGRLLTSYRSILLGALHFVARERTGHTQSLLAEMDVLWFTACFPTEELYLGSIWWLRWCCRTPASAAKGPHDCFQWRPSPETESSSARSGSWELWNTPKSHPSLWTNISPFQTGQNLNVLLN